MPHPPMKVNYRPSKNAVHAATPNGQSHAFLVNLGFK